MKRFFFDLQGKQNILDEQGLLLKSELAAFQAAKRLASELAITRPDLRGTTWIVIKRKDDNECYYLSI